VNNDAARTDWSGTVHRPVAGNLRIASLVPSLTELLFDLGVGDQVVARTGFCVHPREAVRRVPKIGGTKDPDIAKLRSLAPTHLIVNVDENRRDCIELAREFIPNIVVTHPLVPGDNLRLYALFGALFGREREAADLSALFARALGHLDATVIGLQRERVLYLIWKKPWMTVARDTYVSAMLARAGFDTLPLTSDRRYPVVVDDDPAWAAAERILLSSEPYAFRPRDADALQSRLHTPVTLIDGEWTSWYGSRAIAGLAAMAAFRNRLTAVP
jgi:ABC-type Fe3+-hydroxamate transport system substrate-binding protein